MASVKQDGMDGRAFGDCGRGMQILAKPVGSACDCACDYCYYLEKSGVVPSGAGSRMSDEVLKAFVRQYVESQPTPVVEFVWHGGEPTLAGLDFFRKVVDLQRPWRSRRTIRNTLQTNGIRLDDAWCDFLKSEDFFVGLSLDGPKDVHDRYRRDPQGRGTFDRVMAAVDRLQRHGIEFNALACVGRETAARGLDVYRFFRSVGIDFIQFTPIVERLPDGLDRSRGLALASPPTPDLQSSEAVVTPWSVEPEGYGDFMIAVCEEWVRKDVGKMFVMNFEWALNAWLGEPSPVCVFARECGRAVALEHNGDLYACDHYVYPEYLLGNVLEHDLGDMVDGSVASGFGPHKAAGLPGACLECDVLHLCRGGCPKHRFASTPEGEPGLNYLCAGYGNYFRRLRTYLRAMATLIENDYPASLVMEAVKGPLAIRKKR